MRIKLSPSKKSLNKILEESFRRNWELPALSNYGGETLQYSELALSIAKLHLLFDICGLKKGEKVAICAKNQINWGVAFLSSLTYGAVAVPILHEFKPANIRHLIAHSESKILFVGEAMWEKMSDLALPQTDLVVSLADFRILRCSRSGLQEECGRLDALFEERYPKGFRCEDVAYWQDSPEELAMINYTSGTSGFSKGVMLPYRSLLSNVCFANEVEPHMCDTTKALCMLPSAHMYGLMFEFLMEVAVGTHVYFLTRLPSPKIIMAALADIKPDIIIAVPMIIEKIYKSMLAPFISKGRIKLLLNIPMLDQMVMNKIRQSLIQAFGGNFKEVVIGGAAFNREAERFLKRIGFPFTIGYGMTECGPIITYAPHDSTRLGSCGKAAPRMQFMVDSADPANIPGEILVKGDNVFLGYYKNEKATEEAFTPDGWLRTGDLGVVDADGYLYLKGRSKSMILGPNGQNIYPEEIESLLDNMPYVKESLVIEDDNKLVALIYPDFEQVEESGLSADRLMDKLNEAMQLANLELPQYCKLSSVEIFPEEFEKTPKRSIKRYLYQRGIKEE